MTIFIFKPYLLRIKQFISSFNFWLLLLFTAAIGVFLIGMPKYTDDYWFLRNLSEWYYSQGIADATEGGNIFKAGMPWREVFQTQYELWKYDNVRLGNQLVVFFLLLPKWVGSGISLLAWIYTMFISFRMARVDIKCSALVFLAVIMWGVFVAWSNQMGSMVFQYNYVLATAVSLWLISLLNFWKPDNRESSRSRHSAVFSRFAAGAGCFIVGIIAGWWHEAFSISVFAGLCFLCLLFKECRNYKTFCAMAGLLIGIAILVEAPGTEIRAGGFNLDFKSKIPYIVAYNLSYYIFLAVVLFVGYKHGWKRLLSDKLVLFCLINGLIPICISSIIYAEARVTWWSQIIAVIGMMRVLEDYRPRYWNSYSKGNLIWLIPLGMLTFIHLIVADVYVFKIRDYMHKGIMAFSENPEKTVFEDVVTCDDFPLISGRMPDVVMSAQLGWFANFLRPWSGKLNFNIIPSELRNATAGAGRQLKGDIGARELGGRVFMAAEGKDYLNCQFTWFDVDFGNGPVAVQAAVFRFYSEADGKEYIYINLLSPWFARHFKTIQAIEKKES